MLHHATPQQEVYIILSHISFVDGKNYVCTICSQTFTRKWRGRVHNDNFHSGLSEIVRLVDYIIGRINGKYLPSDPSLYRRKNRPISIYGPPRHESQLGSQGNVDQMVRPIMQGIKEGKMAFKNNVVDTAPHSQSFNSGSQQQYDIPDESSVSNHVIQTTIKMANLKKVLSESYPPNEAQEILSITWNCCSGKGDYSLVDKMLKGYGDIAKFKQAWDYLHTP